MCSCGCTTCRRSMLAEMREQTRSIVADVRRGGNARGGGLLLRAQYAAAGVRCGRARRWRRCTSGWGGARHRRGSAKTMRELVGIYTGLSGVCDVQPQGYDVWADDASGDARADGDVHGDVVDLRGRCARRWQCASWWGHTRCCRGCAMRELVEQRLRGCLTRSRRCSTRSRRCSTRRRGCTTCGRTTLAVMRERTGTCTARTWVCEERDGDVHGAVVGV
ncbi:hypothetical protein PLICRDRAFT_314253 [Plicaturopsis crispa FD-325 SS-3]|nr:hypothetical protein PLICRDRAFT_314253 [Plicaturopsis crispa FD-325 SS-3]